MSKIVQGAQEAVAVAKGETLAAAIWHNGYRYVPEAEIVRLRAERDRLRDALRKIAENTATGWPAQVARAALGDTQ